MAESRPTASVLVTGSELLTGLVADANGPFVSRALGDLGFEVRRVLLVGDRPEDLRSGLEFVAGDDLVVTTGGLGPTADDLTAEIVAEFCDAPMEVDTALQGRIHAKVAGWVARTGWDGPALDDSIAKQARVPRGASVLEPVGTAPGLAVARAGGPLVVVLPGPPRELTGMWPAALASPPVAALLARTPRAEPILLRFAGLPESEIAATLRDIERELDTSRVEVTTCLRRSELEVDLHPLPGAEDTARELSGRIVDAHRRRLISDDGRSTDELLAGALLASGRTVATGESCTGGLLAGRLIDRAGSSAYVAGGVVAYSNEAKSALLGVDPALIAEHGAVSPEVARALADGARERFGADIGVGVTGVAGPGGGTEAKPVGYVCFCVTTADGQVLARDPQLPGGRADVRERSVDLAMHLLLRVTGVTGAGAHR
ncbi:MULTISPECIES: competence/damage-inducible protein A [Pseudonocardia]|uniref:CinA-like protein n=2 Tax=Pseudonocardia TaxID=1847 RepID=A0A1Y2MPZ0_PSEAH|nr:MULTISPECIES: competence/damage-inducible protein A [Pseudonocardia]OSY36548.1 Nicotinamide-nucleotide amidohydrolase PncC [Pseudonocardia autotrophica]TDN76271.1 competence/damage-inducible protein cinA [Pseudonocardia autotrophica]BBG00255.1 CinA-like protein [Pseudonocardia autotrophica]GEC29804.1 CinA-like protein [Pseudonocardia saturnea]